jgi:putative pyruvate formate lyase activating enzyme
MNHHTPGYLRLLETGELCERVRELDALLSQCTICPRNCRVDRINGELGFCRSGFLPIVSSFCAHFGEEPVISGTRGSGTIFFGNCNLRCVFCQNHQISQPASSLNGKEVSFERLADIMLELQGMGCHNINLVSPSHFAPQIVRAVEIAASKALRIPLIYNTNGYDSVHALRLLDGVIDIYLPDIKYSDDEAAFEYSKVRDYVRRSREAIEEMKRQVGDLVLDDAGIAVRGLVIRHLVLPNDLAGSEESLGFIGGNLGKGTFVSLMSQYFPTHKADEHPLISRPVSHREYERVLECIERLGLEKGWVQDYSSRDYYRPDFGSDKPFSGSFLGFFKWSLNLS